MNKIRYVIVSISLVASLAFNNAWAQGVFGQTTQQKALSERWFCEKCLGGELYSRTELFFGLSRSNGPDVTEEEFQKFVDDVVTPRFPYGLTLLTGTGQFKDSTGTIIQEGSKLLILLYPFSRKSNRAVEQIREAYKETFQQESVLRIDEQSCISF